MYLYSLLKIGICQAVMLVNSGVFHKPGGHHGILDLGEWTTEKHEAKAMMQPAIYTKSQGNAPYLEDHPNNHG